MKNIISFGAGQNSTAMIILLYNQGIQIDDVIFSDVGNEYPETYIFIEKFKIWCKKKNIKFTTVKSHLFPLKQYYYERKLIPYRMFRSCTDKFKIRPINKYIKENYKEHHINMYLGIASDEKHRMKESGKDTQTMLYPLVEQEINRHKCIEIIKKEGLPIPIKSGCYFCPFQSKKGWIDLYNNHNDLFEESILFEKNCKAYPEGIFLDIPLEKLKHIIKEQSKLTQWFKETDKIEKCVYCHT